MINLAHVARVLEVLLTGDPRRPPRRPYHLWVLAAGLLAWLVLRPAVLEAALSASQELSALGVPPLPVLTESSSILLFFTHRLDDAVEDLAKALALLLLVRSARAATRHLALAPRANLVLAAGIGVGLAALYPLCDALADRAGEHAQSLLAALLRLLSGRAAPEVRVKRTRGGGGCARQEAEEEGRVSASESLALTAGASARGLHGGVLVRPRLRRAAHCGGQRRRGRLQGALRLEPLQRRQPCERRGLQHASNHSPMAPSPKAPKPQGPGQGPKAPRPLAPSLQSPKPQAPSP